MMMREYFDGNCADTELYDGAVATQLWAHASMATPKVESESFEALQLCLTFSLRASLFELKGLDLSKLDQCSEEDIHGYVKEQLSANEKVEEAQKIAEMAVPNGWGPTLSTRFGGREGQRASR